MNILEYDDIVKICIDTMLGRELRVVAKTPEEQREIDKAVKSFLKDMKIAEERGHIIDIPSD